MTKADLINSIAEKAGTTKVDAEKVLKATTDVIMDSVAAGDKVAIHGFGSFERAERSEKHAPPVPARISWYRQQKCRSS